LSKMGLLLTSKSNVILTHVPKNRVNEVKVNDLSKGRQRVNESQSKMTIDVVTIFPEMFNVVLSAGILGKAQTKGLLGINVRNLRDYSQDKHLSTDDYPYGGGSGMVMKPEPIFDAVELLKIDQESSRIILLTPQGETLTQRKIERLSLETHLILICGRYKGVDERVRESLITDEISIGDYVLSGGEIPAMVLIDAIVRVIPGAISDYESAQYDSFADVLLDYPHYTRPAEFREMKVPNLLLSGNHEMIKKWQRQQSLKRTYERRPNLLKDAILSEDDLNFLMMLE